ncbi:hypothetical protein DF186_14130, partial [Enterococcus hirae]
MATLFATVSRRKRRDGQDFAPAWLFVAGYAGLWTLTGAAAYAGDLAIQSLPERIPALQAQGMLIGGAIMGVILASPLIVSAIKSMQKASQVSTGASKDEMPIKLLYFAVIGAAVLLSIMAVQSVATM